MSAGTPAPWEQLASLATLGLARQPGASPAAPDPSLLLPAGTRESTFLRTAAATLLWKLAGERLAADANARTAIGPDGDGTPERVVPDAAAWRLARMLVDEPKSLVDEWFELAAAADLVLPPEWVPALFDGVPARTRTRHARVFGSRLRWLARLDARWTLAPEVSTPSADAWANGSADERLAALRAARAADPALGRAWVESTWDTDPPDLREKIVVALGIGLGPDDEAFLERALDDKRKAVRTAAADTLAQLPTSALVQRAIARLEPHLRFPAKSGSLLGRFASRKLEIELPSTLDKAAQRDGLETKPPAQRKIGERAFWLAQMVALVPPNAHCERHACTPQEFVDAVLGTDHAAELVDALVEAVLRHRAIDWIEPLATTLRTRSAQDQAALYRALEKIAALLRTLPEREFATQVNVQVEALLDRGQAGLAHHLLDEMQLPWSAALTQTALRVLEKEAREGDRQHATWAPSLEGWARHAELATASALGERLLERVSPETAWRAKIEAFVDLIRFRSEMRKELTA